MPRLIPLALPMVAALALSACGKDKPPSTAAAPDTASNFAQPFDARGFDPEWGLKIRGQQITLTRAGQPDLAGTAPGAAIKDHAATWTVALPDHQAMKVSLYASSCTDASSGAVNAYAAEVTLPDATPLSGCAGPPAAAAKR